MNALARRQRERDAYFVLPPFTRQPLRQLGDLQAALHGRGQASGGG